MENKLACIILEGLNWGLGEQVCVKARMLEPGWVSRRENITQPGTVTEFGDSYMLLIL